MHGRLPRGEVFEDPAAVKRFLALNLASREHEVFACMFLTMQHQLICYEEVFRGTICSTSVHPREVVKRALALNAAAVIFAHNHPSGHAEPSRTDEVLTRELTGTLRTVDIKVLDHLVIGAGGAIVSFAERGLL